VQARSSSIIAKSLDRGKPRLHGLYASEQLGLQPGTNFPLGFQLSWLSCRSALEQGLHHWTAKEDVSGWEVSWFRVKLSHGLCTNSSKNSYGTEKLIVTQTTNKSSAYIETEISLPYSQKHATGLCPESVLSGPPLPTSLSQVMSFLGVFQLKLISTCAFLVLSIRATIPGI
jgi:hypothetical protein